MSALPPIADILKVGSATTYKVQFETSFLIRLRRSMLAMMETEGKDHFAHPMFWAPFVVVGEGGRPM